VAGPRGKAFQELLGVLVGRAATVGLLTSDRGYTSPQSQRLFAALKAKALATAETRNWPGSQVPDWARPRLLHTFAYDDESAEALFRHCPRLFGWQDRALPDDLHVLAAHGGTVLGSSTSEDDAWVEMSPEEWRALVDGTDELRHRPMREH
jgi:hypothetical protein